MMQESERLYDQVTVDMLANVDTYKPLVGRHEELANLVEVLNRKEKANPVLLGEAGVGKTAIVEGLAQRIVSKDVPSKLYNSRLLELKLGRLVSMGQKTGSIELLIERLFEELVNTDEDIILFVDEFHTIMEVGKPYINGIQDYIKPYLARGKVRLIGSTTTAEFKQVEQDKAMARRLTPIYINEPTYEDNLAILEGVYSTFEEYHDVVYGEGVLDYIIRVTNRYIKDRVQPDKSIDYLDLVGAKRNLLYTVPDTTGYDATLLEQADEMYIHLKENQMVDAYANQQVLDSVKAEKEAYIEAQMATRQRHITIDDVKSILTLHLGVDVEVDTGDTDDLEQLRTLTQRISERVIGQEEAVKRVGDVLVHHQLGLRNPDKPVGTFLFYGPSGVGKTELAKQIAQEKFGSTNNLLRLDMGEYKEAHKISSLLGSPSGYVGYENGKGAFESLRKKPNQVVLVDEIEKAHPSIMDVFLRVLDEGMLRDSGNNLINFRETIIIFTTNANPEFGKDKVVGFGTIQADSALTKEEVIRFAEFRPEFLNRFDGIVKFNDMTVDILEQITDLRIKELNERYKQQGYTIAFTKPAKKLLASKSLDKGMGARPLNRNMSKVVENSLASYLLGGGTDRHFNFGVENDTVVLKNTPTQVLATDTPHIVVEQTTINTQRLQA